MALQTWVARFVVDHGSVTEEGGRLRTFQRRRLDEPDVDLHVIAEPSGVKGDDLGAQALEAIGRSFMQDRLSLTGSLRRAIHSTNQTLLEWNRRSVPREQVSMGVTGAVVSGNIVYVCQAGPSLLYLRQDGRLQRFVSETDGTMDALGDGEIDALLRRVELRPGDLLLAASPSLDTLISPDTLNSILDRGSDEALPELYLVSRELENFALFAVTCFEDTSATEPTESTIAVDDTLPASPAIARPREPNPFPNPEAIDDPEDDTGPILVTRPPIDISRPVIRLRNGPAGGSEYSRTTGGRRGLNLGISQPRFVILGAAVMLVLFIGAFTVPDLIREGRSERSSLLLEGATAQLAASQSEQDPARKRQQLEDVRRLTTEALRVDADNTTATDLRQQATTALTALDAIFDLGPMTTLSTLSRQVTGDISIVDLTVTGNLAYLLDAAGGRIISVPIGAGTAPTVVFQQNENYGGVPARKPLFTAWEGSPTTGRLLVLDAERKLYEIRPGSPPAPLVIRRSNTWSSVAGIAAYDGNLYVLDPQGNQVHRYLPAATGFDSEPTSALSGQNRLTEAETIAVDGDIYITLKSGEIKRYRGGSDAGFSLGGIDRPLKTVTRIAVLPTAEEVYIADSGNKRVVVAGKDGLYRRQFVSNAFTDVRTVAIDPAGAQLYVVVGDALLTAPIVR
jgi:hypothetical protein